MIRVSIAERAGQPKPFTFPKDDITVGRAQGNDIILPRNNISKRHTRIFRRQGKLIVRDLDSTNGTFLNGRRIHDDEVLHPGDRIFLADFVIIVEEEEGAATPVPPELRPSAPPPLPPGEAKAAERETEVPIEEEPSEISLSASDVHTAPPEMLLTDIEKKQARPPAPTRPVSPPAAAAPPTRPLPRLPTPPPIPPQERAALEAKTLRASTPPPIQRERPSAEPAPPPRGPSLPPRERPAPVPPPERPAPAPPPERRAAATPERTPEPRGEAFREAAPDEATRRAPRDRLRPAAEEPARRPSVPPRPTPSRPAPAPRPSEPAARPAGRAPAQPLAEGLVRERVLARVNEIVPLRDAEPAVLRDTDLQVRIKSAVMDELAILEAEDLLAASLGRDAFVDGLLRSLFGLGPFAEAAADAAVEALVAYPDGTIFERREGKWRRASRRVEPPILALLARRLAAALPGKTRLGPAETFRGDHPELRGLEVSGACGGTALPGPLVRVERPVSFPADLERLVEAGLLSMPMGTFLRLCTDARQAIAVVGPCRASRSAVLRALVAGLPASERVVWVGEQGGEPPQTAATLVPLAPPSVGETLLAETEEAGAGLPDLVRWMQPGLLVIERADTVRDAGMIRSVRARLGAVVVGVDADRWEPALAPSSPAAPGGPAARAALVPGVDPGLAACVDVVAEVNGLTDGTHRMLRLAERATEGGDPFALTAIFEFVQTGLGEAGELLGEYRATRAIPRFVERRKARGKRVDLSLFQ